MIGFPKQPIIKKSSGFSTCYLLFLINELLVNKYPAHGMKLQKKNR